MADIVVVGSINADLVVRAPHFPAPGETISGDDLQIIPGGKGANQAVAAARQGLKINMVGAVGNDAFGPTLIENLKANGVETADIKLDENSATGTAMIVVDEKGQNSIVLSPGANASVTKTDVEKALPGSLKTGCILLQLEIPLETVAFAAHSVHSDGGLVILNPAPARELADELLRNVDILIPNETELSLLTGMDVHDFDTAQKAAQSLIAREVDAVVVTLGDKGALYVNKDDEMFRAPAFKVDAIDSTAAGDAFIGGFVSALLDEENSNEEALRFACACGALATTKFGAQPSLPSREEVERFLSQV